MVETVCRYILSSLRNREANIGEHLKKGSNFEQRERKMLIRGVLAAMRVVRNHSKITSIVLLLY